LIVCAADYVGYKIVEYLTESSHQISFLILDDNDRGGFNSKIKSLFNNVNIPEKIYNQNDLKDEKFLDKISKTEPKIGILAWWPYILKGRILSIPKLGWLNTHPSFLPFNKGKHPNFWCLVDQTPCGVSLQFIDEGIDTGNIIVREEIEISWEDTGKSIYEKSREAMIELVKKTLDDILENKIDQIKQTPDMGTYHNSKEIDSASKIDLDKNYTARQLFNIIRARMFSPYPTAYFFDDGKKYSVEIKTKELKNENEG